jgi:hypothetical protein
LRLRRPLIVTLFSCQPLGLGQQPALPP